MRFLFTLIVIAAASAAGAPQSPSYFIANEGQWEGDFQFKCEVGSTTYYITPQGMTVDFRSGLPPNSSANLGGLRGASSALVGAAGVPPTPSEFDLLSSRRQVSSPAPQTETVRGHVIQIHYASGFPPFTYAEMGGQWGAPALWSPSALRGGARGGLPSGLTKLPHYSNYFLTKDSTKWRSRVAHYENIIIPEVWPGIAVEYRAAKQGVETIYHVQPGADPAQIQMEYLGLDQPLRIDAHGNLILSTSLGDLKEQAPYSYQQQGRVQQKINSSVRLLGENRIGFALGEYNRANELVIDPLLYGTYLGGGAEDNCNAVAPAPDGGVYVAGSTEALSGFPTTPGAYDETGLFVGRRLFCSHFGPNGEFIASTLLGEVQTQGNPNTDGGFGDLAHDSLRNAVWLCGAGKTDWPVTPDAFDTTGDNQYDAIILRLSEDLTNLEYCSYLGGNGGETASEIVMGGIGNIVVVGGTSSTDFPVTPDALYSECQFIDCFILVFDPIANDVVFSTYFGGSNVEYNPGALYFDEERIWFANKTYSTDIPVTENAFQQTLADTNVELGDVMIACITLSPPTVEYCSYLGGDEQDDPYSLAVDDSILIIAGLTWSTSFPVSFDAFDTSGRQALADNNGFVASLNWRTGEYRGTYVGGRSYDRIVKNSFRVGEESVTFLGSTRSADLPVTADAYQPLLNRDGTGEGDFGRDDGFIVKLSRDFTELLYGTYMGGSHIDEYRAAWIENEDSLWVVGLALSIDFPTTPDAIQPDDNGLTSGFVQHFAIDTTADTTDAIDPRPIPSNFSLIVFPNPFNRTLSISLNVPLYQELSLTLYDLLGREVEVIHHGRLNTPTISYTAPPTLASGIYFLRASTQTTSAIQKIALLK